MNLQKLYEEEHLARAERANAHRRGPVGQSSTAFVRFPRDQDRDAHFREFQQSLDYLETLTPKAVPFVAPAWFRATGDGYVQPATKKIIDP